MEEKVVTDGQKKWGEKSHQEVDMETSINHESVQCKEQTASKQTKRSKW